MQPCSNLFIQHIYRDYFDTGSLQLRTMSKQNIELSKQIHTIYLFFIWPK